MLPSLFCSTSWGPTDGFLLHILRYQAQVLITKTTVELHKYMSCSMACYLAMKSSNRHCPCLLMAATCSGRRLHVISRCSTRIKAQAQSELTGSKHVPGSSGHWYSNSVWCNTRQHEVTHSPRPPSVHTSTCEFEHHCKE